ncbi:hypothetical protein E8E12_001540 [Didymella heteroderae]|uniref:Uncharacterized protein n=1 Tax=Didymella heteroderae TaxID=1769908 RepID=A0A9P5BVA5_9PLEO|nr:hypothetical protein E8E12_001540 [Didymella heteroderae]
MDTTSYHTNEYGDNRGDNVLHSDSPQHHHYHKYSNHSHQHLDYYKDHNTDQDYHCFKDLYHPKNLYCCKDLYCYKSLYCYKDLYGYKNLYSYEDFNCYEDLHRDEDLCCYKDCNNNARAPKPTFSKAIARTVSQRVVVRTCLENMLYLLNVRLGTEIRAENLARAVE